MVAVRIFLGGNIVNKTKNEVIRVIPLGGVGEIGKSMYVIEIDEELFVVDSGLMFPENEMLGIDIVIPDITYLEENKERVKGIFLTHGHEDAIGSIAYVLRKIKAPVYGSKLTIALAKEHLKEITIWQGINLLRQLMKLIKLLNIYKKQKKHYYQVIII